ncbi:hypothetical protein QE152_g33771 [Popillia japonica]|uniref:Reverse transcriptase domain-containing protein n=1 Tax=Popillia japonica TaxID=7064 RepID=A0AAW1IW28_POPJA
MQYADDATLLCRGSNDQQLEERGHAMLPEDKAWFVANKLLLNEEKTNELVFTSPRNKTPKSAGSVKLLGTILDTRLTWSDEVGCPFKKVIFCTLCHPKNSLNPEQRNSTRVTYSIQLWGESTHANNIFVLQKKALRAIEEVP